MCCLQCGISSTKKRKHFGEGDCSVLLSQSLCSSAPWDRDGHQQRCIMVWPLSHLQNVPLGISCGLCGQGAFSRIPQVNELRDGQAGKRLNKGLVLQKPGRLWGERKRETSRCIGRSPSSFSEPGGQSDFRSWETFLSENRGLNRTHTWYYWKILGIISTENKKLS